MKTCMMLSETRCGALPSERVEPGFLERDQNAANSSAGLMRREWARSGFICAGGGRSSTVARAWVVWPQASFMKRSRAPT